MFRRCELSRCGHYALHVVSSTRPRRKVSVCHIHVLLAIKTLSVRRWTRISVATSSAVVVGDIRAWRTRSVAAYDESRQIKE